MVRLGRILTCVVLISAVVLSSCAQEEEPCVMCDPLYELTETLQLTDEQVAIMETGTGTLQLTTEQVDMVSDPVEELLNELEPLLDETRWHEVEDVFERLLTQGEADLEALAGIAEELQELEPVGEVGVVTKLEKVSGEVSSSDQIQPLTTGPWQCITIYTPGQETVEGDEDITHSDGWSTKIGFGGPDTIIEMNPDSGALSAQSKSVGARADRAYALLGINFYVPVDNTDVSITTTMRHVATKTVIGPGAAAGVSIPVACGDYSNSAHAWIDYPLGWETGLQIVCTAFAALLPVSAPVSLYATAACAAAQAADYYVQTYDYIKFGQALLNMEGVEEDEITYNAGSLDKGYYRFYIGLNARSCAVVLGLARAVGYAQVRKIEITMDKPSLTLDITSTDGGYVIEPGEGTFPCCPREEIDIVAISDPGYQFVEWIGDVYTVADVNSQITSITVNDNYSITASFEPIQYRLSISSTTGGSVTTPYEGTSTHSAGTMVNLVATPASDYQFVEWTGDVGMIDDANAASTTITMNGDYSIRANFEPIQYSLAIFSTAGGSVTTPGEGAFTRDAGTVVSLVATPSSGYQFDRWTGNVGTIANVNAASITITMNGNYSITANFDVIPPDQYSLTISSTSGGSVTTPGEGTFARDEGTVVSLVATPDSGYQFVNWTGDVGTVANVNAASTTITMNGDYSITANFEEEEEAVTFADPNLEAAIREAIGKPAGPIYPSDLEGLTTLGASERNIADLTGLEHCPNLARLSAFYNQISDISPLANLTGLTHLYLGGNQISDISPLANLTNIKSLNLHLNQISDISPLANLTGLTHLYLGSNQISDISPLASLTSLTWFALSYNQISDISPLANLTSLTGFDLNNNSISDISPLANLTNLTTPQLAYNQISDISPLVDNAGLGEGDDVSLQYNPLSDDSINIYIPQLEARGVRVNY